MEGKWVDEHPVEPGYYVAMIQEPDGVIEQDIVEVGCSGRDKMYVWVYGMGTTRIDDPAILKWYSVPIKMPDWYWDDAWGRNPNE